MRAEIYIEDAEDGAGTQVRFEFFEPFNPKSDAHQLCSILRKYCDQVLVALTPRTDRGDMTAADAALAKIALPEGTYTPGG